MQIISIKHAKLLSHVWLFAAPRTIAYQALLSLEFSSQEYWSGLPFSSPGDLPDSRIESSFLISPVVAGKFFTNGATWEAEIISKSHVY